MFQRLPPGPISSDSRSSEISASIIFVGGPLFFPDSLLRFVQAELGAVAVARVGDGTALRELDAIDDAPRICVLEERFGTVPGDEFQRLIDGSGTALVALAYYQPAVARGLMSRLADSQLPRVGFVPLCAQMDVWLAALRMQLCGERFVPAELLNFGKGPGHDETTSPSMTHPAGMRAGAGRAAGLTDRELQVLELVSSGKQNKLIADELDLSEHTVKLHVHHVLTKLKVRNRTGATTWFLKNRDQLGPQGRAEV